MSKPVEKRVCACGCGKTFRVNPRYPHRRYLNPRHANTDWQRRHRQADKLAPVPTP